MEAGMANVPAAGLVDPGIEPSGKVVLRDIAHEQVEAVSRLIELAVAEPMAWHGTDRNVLWLRTAATQFVVTATVIAPEVLEKRAGWLGCQPALDIRPRGIAVLVNVGPCNLVRDTLEAE